MKNKPLAMCLLGATMMFQTASLSAEEIEKDYQLLTKDRAVEIAHQTSIDLKMHERNKLLLEETMAYSKFIGTYDENDATSVGYRYHVRQEQVIKDTLTLSVYQLFDHIAYSEAQLAYVQSSIEHQDKQIVASEVAYDRGHSSASNVEAMYLVSAQVKHQEEAIRQELETLYRQLEDVVGLSEIAVALDETAEDFLPYPTVDDLNQFIEDKVEEHIEIWQLEEELIQAIETKVPFNGGDNYIARLNKKADLSNRADVIEETEVAMKSKMRETYMRLRAIEDEYSVKMQDVYLQEKQLSVNAVYLAEGMMSQLDYDESVLQYKNLQLALHLLENEHAYLAFMLDHPDLISTKL